MSDRSNINLNAYATEGCNVGTGTGIYKSKCDQNTLQFKTLSVIGGLVSITHDDNNVYFSASTISGSSAIWGSISGTLSDQTDLQSEFDSKLNITTFSGYTGTTASRLTGIESDLSTVSGQTDINTSGITQNVLDIITISGKTIDNLQAGILDYNVVNQRYEPYSGQSTGLTFYTCTLTTCPTGLTRLGLNGRLVLTEIRLSTGNTNTSHLVGDMYWDNVDHTLALQMSADVTQQVGQEVYVLVKNNTGSQIDNGDIVYINGADGDRPTIALARASSSDGAIIGATIGMATENIEIDTLGFVTSFGLVRNLHQKITYNSGDVLYLSTTNYGDTQNTKPISPDFAIKVGIVANAGSPTGTTLVAVTNMTDLTGVTITANNGLTRTGDNISLGGRLLQTTIISGNSQTLNLGVSGDALGHLGVCASTTTIQSTTTVTINGQTSSQIYGNNMNICMSSTGAILHDGRGGGAKGFEYNGDYSAGYTVRSLVDKAYVTGLTNNLQTQITANDNDITYLSGQTDLKLFTSDFNSYTGDTQTTLTGLRTDINTVSGCTSGTPDYLAKFNSTGNGVEDSSILETTDVNILNNTLSVGDTGSTATKIIKASNHATSTVDLIISPGECLAYAGGLGHQDGQLYLNPGRWCNVQHPLYLGSPIYSGNTLDVVAEGVCTDITLYIKSKGAGGLSLIGGQLIYLNNSCSTISHQCNILGMVSNTDFNIKGYTTGAASTNGGSVSIIGGSATGTGDPDGGDVTLCPGSGNGTGSTGQILLDGATCVCDVFYPQSVLCANLPDASGNTGGMVYLSDCCWMTYSDGTNWLKICTGSI